MGEFIGVWIEAQTSFLMVASVGRMVVASVGITLGRGLNSRTKSG